MDRKSEVDLVGLFVAVFVGALRRFTENNGVSIDHCLNHCCHIMSTDNTDAIGMSGRSARGEPSTLLLSLREAFDRTLQLLADGGSSSSDGVGTMFRNSLTTERQLQLYGLYKFITVGPVISSGDHNCTTDPPPNVWNVKAYQKHRAWESLSQTKSAKVMSQDEAMREYIELVVVSAASSSNKDGSLALQNLADQCQGMLDQVDNNNNTSLVSTASDEEETNNVGTRESGAICSSLHCNSTTEKLRKDSLSPKSCEDDAFKPENTVRGLGLASRLQTFVTDILGIQPMIPRGQLDISNADLRFAAWHCFTAFGHVQQQRLYRHYESKIVQQWKTAIISASGVPQKPTTALRKTKDCLVKDEAGPNVIVGLSVRSLFDLYLRVMQYPAGSEVIVSPPFNVPGMLQVLAHHRLQTVAIDLPENHRNDDDVIVAVDCDAIANAVTPRTVAILVVHAFGMITGNDDEMQALRMLATTQNKNGRTINIIEDCAECFAGLGEGAYLGSPHADVSFFSFGMIKTMTALNGGVAIFRNQVVDKSSKAKGLKTEQFESMIRLHSSSCYEVQQTNGAFLWKVCKSFVMRAIADSPFLYGLIYIVVSRILGLDFDGVVTSLLRGFRLDKDGAIQHRNTDGETPMPQNGLISQIRKRPSSAMLALLHRRLYQSTPVAESVSKRVKSCRQLSKHLLEERGNNSYPIRIPTSHRGSENFFWLYPVLANDPDRASEHMRSHGFDATTGASQLCCVAPPGVASCPRAKRFMNEALYLPMDCGSGWSIEQMHVRLVRAIHAIPKPNGDNHPHPHLSAPIAAPTKGGMEKKCVTLLFVTLASGLLPACLFRFFFAVVVHGLELACCLTTLVTLMLWLLRLSSGNLYLELSRGFAKYSALLQNGNERQDKGGLANATGSVEAGSSANVLSSIRALDLPLMYGGDELRSVLLTGGIGFIGSMVLRDLLFYRETLCVDRVVVLCRPKRGKSANERVAAVLDEDLYSFLTENEKNLLVDVVEGDTTQAHAGLSDRVVNRLCHNYNITHVFHCAASVSFTQNLRDAATANILSTLNVQSMSSRLNKSRVQFVHISSAFVHGLSGDNNQPLPEELFSLGKFDPIEIYKSMCGTQFYASKAMCELGFPNTYTFSKSVCEHLLVLNDPNTLIIRPSIVGPAVETPHEGWAGRTPSTLVAAAGLYLSYQWNVWSFGGQRVPCVPVDVVSRFVVAKAFWKSSSELPKRLPASIETSSEESFEKLSRTSTPSSEAGLSGTDSDSSSAHQIFNAAWDIRSPSVACFTWRDYAGAVTQIGSVMGYFSRPTAYIGLLVSSRLSPKASMSAIQFERLHTWCVQYPFQLVLRIRNVLGFETKQMRQLESILDLPLLFYPFMNNGFHFNSELIAPLALNGERYVISCVAAAHFFVSRALARHNRLNRLQHPLYDEPRQVMSFLPVGGFMHHDKSPSLWWALTQPQGNFLIRVTGWMLAVVLRACYSEVTVDVISFAATLRAKDATSSTCLILAPTHRSFFDFLLLSYVSFCIPELQIRIPCIVAADEFARLPVIGWLLQFLGAFFVRRGRMAIDPCLAATISSIKSVSSFSDRAIEVFIEGTRSRDRRFVKPKTGVLRCLREAGGNYVVVPITISYDRIAEQESLVKEASGGTGTSLNVGAMLSWLLVSVSNNTG